LATLRGIWQRNHELLRNGGSLFVTTGPSSLFGFVYWIVAAREFSQQAVGYGSATVSAMTLRADDELFFPAFFGNDTSNVITPNEVHAVLAFLKSAKPGPLLVVIGNMPDSDTANYDKFAVGTIFDACDIAPINH
jgi:hypothetical protein